MNLIFTSAETDKIELFLLRPEHVSLEYVSWLVDPGVNRFLESRFVTHTLESTRQFVQSCFDSPTTLMLGIRSKTLGLRHIGNIKLAPIDIHHGLAEVGILVGDKAAWGQGIGSDAINSVARIAKNHLSLRKLTAGCYGSNLASKKTFIKAGFEIEGRREKHYVLDGQLEALVMMARWL